MTDYKICLDCGDILQINADNKDQRYCQKCMGKLSTSGNEYVLNELLINFLGKINRAYQDENLARPIEITEKLLANFKQIKKSNDDMMTAISRSD